MDENERARHLARMERRKAVADESIARAREDRGVLMLITGNGKGKTSSAFGALCRALGHGQRVGLVRFSKGAAATGEVLFLRQFGRRARYHAMTAGFTCKKRDREVERQAADTVSEIRDVRHAFRAGVKAGAGVDF